MTIPPLKDNCFAMPAGVEWTSVDDALDLIEKGLHPVVEDEKIQINQACGRILSNSVDAKRSNPPMPNSAVDGYGFKHETLPDDAVIYLPLQKGVSAAGKPFEGAVEGGKAIRILTGAVLPKGVDTVILEEDVAVDKGSIVFHLGLKAGANVRMDGEDVKTAQKIFNKGHVLRPQDLALLSATGVCEVSVYKPLRVAVISTGTELIEIGQFARDDQIYDANKPMLLNLLKSLGFTAVDGGHFRDDPDIICSGLNAAAQNADAIFVSGGASAGDEDYVSRLLKEQGVMHTWRVAVKPGRPLAMALWNNVPTFGFPGNPVAAFVCALIFGLPSLKILAGYASHSVQSYQVPAGFSKSKKAGRREYLRARMNTKGQVEVFKSEGSGRISGLTWSDGLVELPDEAIEINIGDMVRFTPYASFGL